MTNDIVPRLLASAPLAHAPALLEEAAHELQSLREQAGGWEAASDLQAEEVEALRNALAEADADFLRIHTRLFQVLNVRRSDDQVGIVCATCGIPVESEPCPQHSPEGRLEHLQNAAAWAAEIYGTPESERTLREGLEASGWHQ